MEKVKCEVHRMSDGAFHFEFPGANYTFCLWPYINGICGGRPGMAEDHGGKAVAIAINNRLEWRNMVGVE